jgi:hypothetical protein
MGRVTRSLEFNDRSELEEYLRVEHKIQLHPNEKVFKEVELGTIIVDMEIEEHKSNAVLNLSKPVSLKAFLLAREANMNVNMLISDIDTLMQLSKDGVKYSESGILDDDSLSEFFERAGIKKTVDREILKDNYRTAKVEYTDGHYDFNKIEELQ